MASPVHALSLDSELQFGPTAAHFAGRSLLVASPGPSTTLLAPGEREAGCWSEPSASPSAPAAPTALPSAGTHPKHPCGMPGGKAGTMDHGKVLEVRGQLVSDLGMKS